MALYPTVEQVFNLARVYLNDTLPGPSGIIGEGQKFLDSWLPNITILNDAIDAFQLDMENSNAPILRTEVIIPNIPVINSAMGQAVPNPAVFQYLSFTGFFDGLNFTSTPALPSNLILPYEIWQVSSGIDIPMSIMGRAAAGLTNMYQTFDLGSWEWRGDSIFWNGSLVPKDVRIRYQAGSPLIAYGLNPALFATTVINLMDSLQPLAYRCAYTYLAAKSAPGAAQELLNMYDRQVAKLVQRYTRANQGTVYDRSPYGETGDLFGWFH